MAITTVENQGSPRDEIRGTLYGRAGTDRGSSRVSTEHPFDTALGVLLCVRDVIINSRNTELFSQVNNPVICMAVIALPDMYLGMS